MIGSLVFLAFAVAQGEPDLVRVPSLDSTRGLASFKIPDELAPAVVPYLGCLMARDGTHVGGGFDPRPADIQRGGDCTAYREQAVQRADSILRRIGGRSAEQRRSYIEDTLVALEGFHGAWANPTGNER